MFARLSVSLLALSPLNCLVGGLEEVSTFAGTNVGALATGRLASQTLQRRQLSGFSRVHAEQIHESELVFVIKEAAAAPSE